MFSVIACNSTESPDTFPQHRVGSGVPVMERWFMPTPSVSSSPGDLGRREGKRERILLQPPGGRVFF